MEIFKPGSGTVERYMDASVELFMECYAGVITGDLRSDDEPVEPVPERLILQCKNQIKAFQRRRRLSAVVRCTGKVIKSAAVLTVAFLAIGSFLFITVEAVRKPILNFYIQKNDGNWVLSDTPLDTDNPMYNAPESGFDKKDPLGSFLVNEFQLYSLEGTLEDGMTAVYLKGDEGKGVSFHSATDDVQVSFNTEEATVTELEISGFTAIMSSRTDKHSVYLIWHRTDLNMYFSLNSDCLSEEELISMAESLNYLIKAE